MRRWVMVAVPDDRRTLAFSAALAAHGLPPPIVVPWTDAIARPQGLTTVLRDGDVLRIESPGSDAATWEALARLGGAPGGTCAEPGLWRPGQRWYAGLAHALGALATATAGTAAIPDGDPEDILAMTDKAACRRRLAGQGVRIPDGFTAPADPEALRAELATRGWRRVFVKPRWGSSGAGVMAWQRSGPAADAAESLAMACEANLVDGRLELRNAKRLRTYRDRRTIDALLTAILGDGAVVERWIPKLGVTDGPLDLRVVVIDGEPRHAIARVGRGPITNLHLDARRLEPDALFANGPPDARAAVGDLCRHAAEAFPRSRRFGLDVLLDRTWQPWAIEVNAWGDHLPGIRHDGLDTYGAEIAALHREAPCAG